MNAQLGGRAVRFYGASMAELGIGIFTNNRGPPHLGARQGPRRAAA